MARFFLGLLAGAAVTLLILFITLPAAVLRPVYYQFHNGNWMLHKAFWSNTEYNYLLGAYQEGTGDLPHMTDHLPTNPCLPSPAMISNPYACARSPLQHTTTRPAHPPPFS